MAKKYKVRNVKYGNVGEEYTFAALEKAAADQGLANSLREETRDGDDGDLFVVVDSYGVVVAEVEPEPEKKPKAAAKTAAAKQDEDEEENEE